MKELLAQLCTLDGVSGYEDDVCSFIKNYASAYVDTISTDALGNLFLFKKGAHPRAQPCALCAHMDEVGFLVRSINDNGSLSACPVGTVDPKSIISRRMTVGDKKLTGVVSLKAIHLTTAAEREVVPTFDKLHVDIGATSKAQAQTLVDIAEQITFKSSPVEIGDSCMRAKALDSRAPCAALLTLLQQSIKYDTWFVFTTNSKIGFRGASVVSRSLDPGLCIVLDGSAAGDLPDVSEHMVSTRLRQGAVISFMDKGAIYSRSHYRALTKAASLAGIRWQSKSLVCDVTDASVLQNGGHGAVSLSLSVPIRNMDTSVSTIYLPDLAELIKLAKLAMDEAGEYNV